VKGGGPLVELQGPGGRGWPEGVGCISCPPVSGRVWGGTLGGTARSRWGWRPGVARAS